MQFKAKMVFVKAPSGNRNGLWFGFCGQGLPPLRFLAQSKREVSRSHLEVKLIRFRQADFCEGRSFLIAT
jgi:hypothetical protein